MKRIYTAVLSAFLFALIYAAVSYEPLSAREPNTYYFGFWETYAFVLLYSSPVFFLVGIPVSILLDYLAEKRAGRQYVKKLLLYFVAGLLAGMAAILFYMPASHSFSFLATYALVGAGASLLYFHLHWLLKIFGRK